MPVMVLVLMVVVGIATADRDPSSRSSPPRRPTSGAPETTAETVWTLSAQQLRPEVGGAEFVIALDGDLQTGYVTGTAGLWLSLTGDPTGNATVLHAIDPATGTERWKRALDGALCATQAPKSGLLCASVLTRDPATGLGTQWRLHLLDPATGEDRLTRDVDAWLTAVHWTGTAFVLLEQRLPAPHAVVRAFASDDLRPLWDRDLVDEPRHRELFSDNRIISRHEPERPGLALDRPRFRDVGDGLIAIWAGQSTAFIDRDDGRLVMFPHCSRLVDDGRRLWCNETDGATAYSYAGALLVRVTGPRLAFPDDDGLGVDRNRAVFIDDEGAAVAVDAATGKVGAAYTPPGVGSAFGNRILPRTSTVGEHTFLIGEAGALLINPDDDAVTWTNPDVTHSDLPILLGDRVLLGTSRREAVDLGSGRTVGRVRFDGTYTDQIGNRLASASTDQLALVRVG